MNRVFLDEPTARINGSDAVTPDSENCEKPEAACDAVTEEPKELADLDAYYDAERKEYLWQNKADVWIPLKEGQFKKRLASMGISTSIPKSQNGAPVQQVSDADKALLQLQDHRHIDYHGKLCGRAQGFYHENDIRFLVTQGAKLIEPDRGDFSTLKAFLVGLLREGEPEHGDAQWHTFNGWLQTSLKALRSHRIQQAQAVAIAGPTDCGKSLVQQLITHALGGRSAKAAPYMLGRTDFNGELFEAEHLMLEDEFMSTAIRDRLRLGANIKSMTVSTSIASCQRKHRHPVNLPAWWRVTISLNDDPEALLVLPPLDDHVEDKIILLRASRFDLPMPTGTTEERELFWNQLMKEMPAYLYWLLHDYEIPEYYRDPKRYVVKTWHHPGMTNALESLSPEIELLSLIDRANICWSGPWKGTAAELEAELLSESGTRDSARKLLTWHNACGTYLGRVAKKRPDRVRSARSNSCRKWEIASEESPFDPVS